jgi:hypothetical protein
LHPLRNREEIKSEKCSPPFNPRSFSSHLKSKSTGTEMHSSIILPVVVCGCVNWSLTLREERGLRTFENVLRKVLELKRRRYWILGKIA